MNKIEIIKATKDNWYKKGQVYIVKDAYKYQPYGVQVVMKNNGHVPDVVSNGHFKYIE